MTTVRRTHDQAIYLAEDRYDDPKEIFKMLGDHVHQVGAPRPGQVVCDFGCAAGEWLSYLCRRFPGPRYAGYDVVPALLERARGRVPGATFHQGSVLDRMLLPEASVDWAFMVGVHPIFDAFEPSLSNLLWWTRPGGRISILGPFNPFPIDVWVTYRLIDDPDPDHREPGWNLFSKASLARYLDRAVGPGRYTFLPWELPCDLPHHPDDPVRTWTVQDRDGRRLLINGLGLLRRLELLEITR